MRSRGRFKTRRSRRDAEGPVSYRAVPLARFRREVVALLMAGRTGTQRLDSTKALRLVIRWDKVVRLRHGQGKPPCNVADHILKYERDQAVCPCGNPLPSPLTNKLQHSRDKDRGACRCRSRDPDKKPRYPKFQNIIYRNCPCGETAHKYSGYDDAQKGMIFECRNCRRKTYNKPGWYIRAREREREGGDRG